jgi:hypothetical protein
MTEVLGWKPYDRLRSPDNAVLIYFCVYPPLRRKQCTAFRRNKVRRISIVRDTPLGSKN